MPEIVYYVASSLDGRIATADGGVAWLDPFNTPGEDYGYKEFFASVGAVLMGRKSWEKVLAFPHWPLGDKPCWVFSRRVFDPGRPGVVVTSDAPAEIAATLDARGIRRAWLLGGGELAGSLRSAGLITEWIVAIVPAILGQGPALVAPGPPTERLALQSSIAYANGLVMLRYRPEVLAVEREREGGA